MLVLSPATVLLNRGNISDTLMVLLLLLAADATVSAIVSGRLRSLIVAGVLVGLAFQAKMIEAWLVLPALALAYLVERARAAAVGELARLAAAGAVVAAVSLSWMVLVSVWPAHDRPYVDGSSTNSIFSQVFVYNGFGRVDQASPNQLLTKAIGLTLGSTPPGWHRLLSGTDGRDTAWLIPAALVALVACLLACRRATPAANDLLRAATAMWGTWLVVLLVVFSASTTINPYYTAALSPAIAALVGMGLALAWEHRASPVAPRAVAATVAVTCGYAIWLLPSDGVGVVSRPAGGRGRARRRGRRDAAPGGAARRARVATRAGARGAGGDRGRGGARGGVGVGRRPSGSGRSTRRSKERARRRWRARSVASPSRPSRCSRGSRPQAGTSRMLMATQTSAVAAPFIYDSGREVLPIGGFTGTIPEPSGRDAAVDDPRGRLPHRDPIADGHRSPPRAGGPAVLPAADRRPGLPASRGSRSITAGGRPASDRVDLAAASAVAKARARSAARATTASRAARRSTATGGGRRGPAGHGPEGG